MHTFSLIAEYVTTVGYLVAAIAYIAAYVKPTVPMAGIRYTLLMITLAVQVVFIGSVSADLHHCLVTSGLEVIELLAFVIGLMYLVLERVTKSQASGVFIVPIVFVLQFVGSFRTPSTEVSKLYGSVAMNLHVTNALFGYAALAMAGAYGGMYLLLFRSIKRGTFGKAFDRFPSLGSLEQMSIISVRFALAFLSVAIVVGLFWLPSEVPDFSYYDPKLVTTLVLWLVYAGGLLARRYMRWEGKRLMEITLYGFIVAIASLTLINVVFRGFHKFS